MSYTPNLEKIEITDNATGRTLELDSNGNAALILNADQENDGGEVGAPYVNFRMDASLTSSVIGQVQIPGQDPTGAAATNTENNAFYVGTNEANALNFATNKDVKFRISGASSFIEQLGNAPFIALQLKNLYTAGAGVSAFDSANRNSFTDSSIHMRHETNGASQIAFLSQPPGTFGDRRSTVGAFNSQGTFVLFNSGGFDVFRFFTGRDATASGYYQQIRQTSTATDGATDYYSDWGAPGRNVCRIRADGNLLNFNNSYGSISDVSLKENIQDAPNYLNDICQVKVRKYSMKDDNLQEPNRVGVIAQELEEVFPKLVETEKEGIKSVKYSVFVPILIKAIQELKSELDAVKIELAALKG